MTERIDVRDVIRAYECPDCGAHAELVRQQGAIFDVAIAHDPSCPYYRAMEPAS